MYNTEFCAKVIGVEPSAPKNKDGTPVVSKNGSICNRCGRTIEKGEPCAVDLAGKSFTDHYDLVEQAGNETCQWCYAVKGKDIMTALGGTVVTSDGVFPFRSDANRAHFLLNPPEPPYLILINSEKISENLAWKAPVNHSKRIMLAQLGSQVLEIRTDVLKEAFSKCKRLRKMFEDADPDGKVKALGASPFTSLDRKSLKEMSHAQIQPRFLRFAKDNEEARSIIKYLTDLTLGEYWALSCLVKTKETEPIKPEAIKF
jgi:CRISPR type IV-associated protein Csf1